MNVTDYIILGILLVFLITGYRKGFLMQALSIIGVAVAFVLASLYHARLAGTAMFETFRQSNESGALVAAFVCIFFFTAGITGLLATWIRRKTKKKIEGGLNKSLGALLGLASGTVLLGGLALGLQEWRLPQGAVVPVKLQDIQEKGQDLVADSYLIPYLTSGCLALIDVIPQEGREELVKLYQENDDWLPVVARLQDPATTARKDGETTPGEGSEASSEKSSKEAKPLPPELLDLGALRRLIVRESELSEEPTPTAGTDEEPEEPEKEPAEKPEKKPAEPDPEEPPK